MKIVIHMHLVESIFILVLLLHMIKISELLSVCFYCVIIVVLLDKLSILQYVIELLRKMLKNPEKGQLKKKYKKEIIFDFDAIYGKSLNTWMSQVQRTKTSIDS